MCDTGGDALKTAGRLFEREGTSSLKHHQARGTSSNSIVLIYSNFVMIISSGILTEIQIGVLGVYLKIRDVFMSIIGPIQQAIYQEIMLKKKALIFGVTGQDGSYLAKLLLKKKI